MSLWSTLPPDEQVLTEQLGDEALALAEDQDERADLAAYRRAGRRARTRRLGTGALGMAVLVVLWQLVATLISDPVFLPSVSQTVASFAHYFAHPYPSQGKPLWYDALIHLWRAHGVGLPRQMIPAEFEPALDGGYIVAGSASTVRERLKRDNEVAGINYCICRLAFGDLTFEESKRSVELFAREVMPAL